MDKKSKIILVLLVITLLSLSSYASLSRFSKGINKELGEYFRSKFDELPNCGDDFDLIYSEILDYCKNYDKTIVIDCAQFHCIKNINLLKGKIIIIRNN